MPTNLSRLISDTTRNLDDLGAVFFTRDSDIEPSIQEGYRFISALCETIESQANVDFVSGLVFYDFSTYISDYLRVYGIYNNNTNRWLQPTILTELYRLRDDWELANGEPYLFLPVDPKHVALFPVLSTASGSMTVVYKARATRLGANDYPELPELHQDVLTYDATGDLLTQCEEWYKAIDWMNMTELHTEEIRKIVRERSSPNQLYYHRGIF